MNILRTVHKLLHRDHLIWTMTPEANIAIAIISGMFFAKTITTYTSAGNQLYAGFLLGISVGLFFGAYWHFIFAKHWDFYRKFYSVKTKNKDRINMLSKKIDYEIPSYVAAVVFGFVLVYLSISNFVWLASSLFFGFIFGGSLAMAAVLKHLA